MLQVHHSQYRSATISQKLLSPKATPAYKSTDAETRDAERAEEEARQFETKVKAHKGAPCTIRIILHTVSAILDLPAS